MRDYDEAYMLVALAVGKLATCPIRQVGCVAVDKNRKILSTGFNGVPSGYIHCTDNFCGDSPCYAVHAEVNAIMQCTDITKIEVLYVTLAPCIECAKLIANTGCKQVVFIENHKKEGIALLKNLGIKCKKLK